ncbi:HlyD family secretion protein [Tropicimonas sp. IMCC34043]|uniref:HlyD family secretion protein n=1 Tax=Tropicimonas sp. IMCC34043 TaxID=2248760 RepID=UPI000E247260|nr:biotin/lipoyl-binding protein [Tropicimonas sp. IMCC34043]
MLELLFCATLTVLPDYLYRRFAQGRRIGHEITLFSVWYELRYGLTACLLLTISLITVVFYYHPSSTDVSSYFRTVTILSERPGRVKEVFVTNNQILQAGDPIFSLEDDTQRAAVDSARARVAETEAEFSMVEAELAASKGAVDQAAFSVKQAQEELAVQQELLARGSGAASQREVDRLANVVAGRQGALDSAQANLLSVETRKSVLLPAQIASANAALREAEVAVQKSVVYASIQGEVQQFALQPGDLVNPILRPAGILVPREVGAEQFLAGFNQISAQVLKVGMIGEMTCLSMPFKIIPMQVNWVQDFLPSGQFRPSDQIIDVQDRARPGTVSVRMAPLFKGGADGIPRGSKCIANVYTSNHERLATEDLPLGTWLFLHMVDTVGLVHALILRIQALLLPVQTLVLSGH